MIINKKGFINFDDPRHLGSLVCGLLLIPLGLIPILSHFNVIAFNLPGFINNVVGIIGLYVVAGVGFWLFIEAWMEEETARHVTLLCSILFLAVGIISILNQFNIIGFTIPFLVPMVYNVIFVIEGLLLILAAILMY